jgi:hypothetical protein
VLVLGFLGTLLGFLLFEDLLRQTRQVIGLNNRVLDDQILAYHLDWKAIQDQKLLIYLYVKKVNAVVRYQSLAGVSYKEAQKAIEYLLAHPHLLPSIPQKRRPALPQADDERLRLAIALGKREEAMKLYQGLVDVDSFTAKQVVERMSREHYLETLDDSEIVRFLAQDEETEAIHLLVERYGLSDEEALYTLDAMQARLMIE